jgi:hypothetical protein
VTTSYFQEQGQNYIGTPYGILHTNKPSSEVSIYDFGECGSDAPTQEFKNQYKVVTGDAMVSLELHHEIDREYRDIYKDISVVFNGQWLGLND